MALSFLADGEPYLKAICAGICTPLSTSMWMLDHRVALLLLYQAINHTLPFSFRQNELHNLGMKILTGQVDHAAYAMESTPVTSRLEHESSAFLYPYCTFYSVSRENQLWCCTQMLSGCMWIESLVMF